MRDPEVIIVVGGQWGDEGKGKVIDLLAEESDVVYKPNGGRNAGHTVENPFGKFAMHLVPAGIFYSRVDNIVGDGVSYSLQEGLDEIYDLESRGISTKKLFISPKTHLSFRYHEIEDSIQESFRGEQVIGTTETGNGPSYSDRADRIGLRAELLNDPDRLMKQLAEVLNIKIRCYFPKDPIPEEFRPEYYEDLINEATKVIGPKVVDTDQLTNKHLRNGSRMLIEGSHGTLLDINAGTYPRVTSSSCTVNGLLMGAGLPRVNVDRAIGIFKAYQTRVGNGGMPTELLDDKGALIRQKGHEFGTTTGRPRRVGFFDGVAARYAQGLNGFTEIVITKGDVLTNVGGVRICRKYLLNGKPVNKFPFDDQVLQRCQPVYDQKEYDWSKDFTGARDWEDLPESAQNYFLAIAKCVPEAKLTYIGTGPKRQDVIIVP